MDAECNSSQHVRGKTSRLAWFPLTVSRPSTVGSPQRSTVEEGRHSDTEVKSTARAIHLHSGKLTVQQFMRPCTRLATFESCPPFHTIPTTSPNSRPSHRLTRIHIQNIAMKNNLRQCFSSNHFISLNHLQLDRLPYHLQRFKYIFVKWSSLSSSSILLFIPLPS